MNRGLVIINVLGDLDRRVAAVANCDHTETVAAGGLGCEGLGSTAARAARRTGPIESTFVRASGGNSFPPSQASTIAALLPCPPYSGVITDQPTTRADGVAVPFRRSSSTRARGKCSVNNQAPWDGAEIGTVGRRRSAA